MFVNRDDGDHNTLFRQVLPIAHDHFFNLLERAGVHQDASCRNGFAPEYPIFCKLDALSVLQQENFSADTTQLVRESGVTEQVAVLPVHRHEVLGFTSRKSNFCSSWLACPL